MTTTKSPHRDATPSVASLSGGTMKAKDALLGFEQWQLVLFINGSRFWSSRFFHSYERWPAIPVIYHSKGNKYRLLLYHWWSYRGRTRFAYSRMPFYAIFPPKGGRMYSQTFKGPIKPPPRKAKLPPAIQIVRRGVRNGMKSHSKGPFVPESRPPRPSPEVIPRGVITFVEGNNGGYFKIPSTASYNQYVRTYTGVRTPGFGKLKPAQRPVNPHSVQLTRIHENAGAYYTWIPSTQIFYNEFNLFTLKYGPPAAISGHLPLSRNKALQRLIEAANAEMTANLAQDVAQIGKTCDLIANTANRMRRSALALKKGNFPKAIEELWNGKRPKYGTTGPRRGESTANNWLELQYGWKPLMQSIDGSLRALAKLNFGDTQIQRVTASATCESQDDSTFPMHTTGVPNAGKHTVYQQTKTKFVLRFRVASPLQAFMAQTGFTNPINLGWELLPFSFVADWFLPIGPWLETLTVWDGLAFLDGSETNYSRRWTSSAINFGTNMFAQDYTHQARYIREEVLLNRVKLSAFPTQKLLPPRNGLSSVMRAANAVALVVSVFGKK